MNIDDETWWEKEENNRENAKLTKSKPQSGVTLVCNTWDAGLKQVQGCNLHWWLCDCERAFQFLSEMGQKEC